MKIKMLYNYSDRDDHPMEGDILEVVETVYDEDNFIDLYRCKWECDVILEVYEYECEEVL